jgi:sirohydrochlorin ferrochelatase
MRVAGLVTTLVLTAHGSADPRSAANTRAVAGLLSRLRPGLDVRVAFLEQNAPVLGDVLAGLSGTREAVVTPLLLADAYHARIDIPGQIARSGAAWSGIDVRQADALGEDDRLVSVLRDRLAGLGVSRLDDALGVLVVAIGSSDAAANARTAAVAGKLVIAPWFLAPGRLTDRVCAYAHDAGIPMAPPLGAHRLVAATVLERFDQAVANRMVA